MDQQRSSFEAGLTIPAEFSTFAKRRPSAIGPFTPPSTTGEPPHLVEQAESSKMRSDHVPLKPPRTTTGGVKTIHLQNRPAISETQHTFAYDGDTDSSRHSYFRLPWRSKHRNRRNRVVEKKGNCNIEYKQISKRRRRFFTDAYTTLIDSSWLDTLLIFAASFYFTWLFYAVIYYLICWHHGDLIPENMERIEADENPWNPCVLKMDDFASAFLFSLETQHTIGYGSRQTTNECTSAIIVMSTQSVIGCLIQAFMVGLVFAKLARPQQRARTVVFSKKAVISERDGKLCLVFRVGDMRDDSFIVGAQLSVKLIRRRCTAEGEMYHDTEVLNIQPDTSSEPCVFLIWPLTVFHVIDEDSPFYEMAASEMAHDKFEIVVGLEGTIESTSSTFQARTSYLPDEILWGHRFEPMVLYRKDHNKYQVNFSAFDSTYEVDTPLCSSKDLQSYNEAVTNPNCFNDIRSSVPFHQYSHLPSEPSSPPTYAVKNEHSNSQQLPNAPNNRAKSNGVNEKSVVNPPLIEINDEKPKQLKKQLARMESVPETQPENSSATSTPSGTRNRKGVGTSTSQSIGASSPEEILTQKLLASSERNADMHSDDESSNDDTQMTDDVSGSTEKLCNGNSNNKKIEIV